MRMVHTHIDAYSCSTHRNGETGKRAQTQACQLYIYKAYTLYIALYTAHSLTHTQSIRCDAMNMMDILLVYRCSTIYYIHKAFYVEWKMVQFLLVREKKKCSRRSSFIRLFARYQFVSGCLGIVVVSVDAFSNVKCSYSRCARKIEIIFFEFLFFPFFSTRFVDACAEKAIHAIYCV